MSRILIIITVFMYDGPAKSIFRQFEPQDIVAIYDVSPPYMVSRFLKFDFLPLRHVLLTAFIDDNNFDDTIFYYIFFENIILILSIIYAINTFSQEKYDKNSILIFLFLYGISPIFNNRTLMVRTHVLSTALMVLYITFLIKNKNLNLFITSLFLSFYAILHWLNIFPILGLYCLLSGCTMKEKMVKTIITISSGVLSMLWHPAFPNNLLHLKYYAVDKTFESQYIPVGNEWYSLSVNLYFTQILLVLILFYSLFFLRNKSKLIVDNYKYIVSVVLFFMSMTFISVRFFDYFIPIIFIFGSIPLLLTLNRFTYHYVKYILIFYALFNYWTTYNSIYQYMQTSSLSPLYAGMQPSMEWM